MLAFDETMNNDLILGACHFSGGGGEDCTVAGESCDWQHRTVSVTVSVTAIRLLIWICLCLPWATANMSDKIVVRKIAYMKLRFFADLHSYIIARRTYLILVIFIPQPHFRPGNFSPQKCVKF